MKLSKENKAHRKSQAEAREAVKPRPLKDQKFNPLPNRKTRRQQAMNKAREAWGEANQKWRDLNVQTIRNPRKQELKAKRRADRLAKKAARKEARKNEVPQLSNKG